MTLLGQVIEPLVHHEMAGVVYVVVTFALAVVIASISSMPKFFAAFAGLLIAAAWPLVAAVILMFAPVVLACMVCALPVWLAERAVQRIRRALGSAAGRGE